MEKEMEKSASGEKYQQPARPAIISNAAQIFLRILVVVCSASAAYLMFTSKEETLVYDLPMSAKWSDSPSTKYGAYVDGVVGASALVSLFITLITMRQRGHTIYFLLFLHDLVMMSLQLGGCVAATSIGLIIAYYSSSSITRNDSMLGGKEPRWNDASGLVLIRFTYRRKAYQSCALLVFYDRSSKK
ncbi:CASP-like protein [Drosera capensis]